MTLDLPDLAATQQLGRNLASILAERQPGALLALSGSLGAGKTSLARALIRALGHPGPVVSPTYTLVEPYELGPRRLYHLDLYRISDLEELAYLGLREIDTALDWVVVEWFERGAATLPAPDLCVDLEYRGAGRRVELTAATVRGRGLLAALEAGRAFTPDSGAF